MKKAKIMFTALTVLAVVGGALAFKAKTFSLTKIYTTNPGNPALCNAALDVDAFQLTVQGQGVETTATINAPDPSHPDGFACAIITTTTE